MIEENNYVTAHKVRPEFLVMYVTELITGPICNLKTQRYKKKFIDPIVCKEK